MVDGSSISSISAVAAIARGLYRRAKTSGPDFADVAPVVRSLHSVIKHLRAEAEDPDSLLNSSQQESSIYARQLTPIVEDTDFTLKQLDTILEKYGSYPSDHSSEDGNVPRRNRANSRVKRMEDRERDMVQLIRTKLANQKTNIDIFLDTVQLHNPTRQHQPVNLDRADDKQMNNIKDKVDAVAARIFQRRARGRLSGDVPDESQEDMWQQFWVELVKEGFSGDILRKHKVSSYPFKTPNNPQKKEVPTSSTRAPCIGATCMHLLPYVSAVKQPHMPVVRKSFCWQRRGCAVGVVAAADGPDGLICGGESTMLTVMGCRKCCAHTSENWSQTGLSMTIHHLCVAC